MALYGKIRFAGVYRLASDLFRLWVAPRSAAHDAAKRYSVSSELVQTSFLTRVRHERLFAIGKRSLSPWANTIALCAELPSDKLTNFNHPFMN